MSLDYQGILGYLVTTSAIGDRITAPSLALRSEALGLRERIVICGYLRLDLGSMRRGVLECDQHFALVQAELLGDGGHSLRLRAGGVPERRADLPYVGAAGERGPSPCGAEFEQNSRCAALTARWVQAPGCWRDYREQPDH